MRSPATSTCPQCGESGVPLIFGRPVEAASRAAKAGEIRLAGCMVPDGERLNWACGRKHQWRDGADLRGWDVRLIQVLESHGLIDAIDLEDLDYQVERRAERWGDQGVEFVVVRWPITDKPAASLRVATSSGASAELILWASGEAELMWTTKSEETDDVTQEHYELTSMSALSECLFDLEARVGILEKGP